MYGRIQLGKWGLTRRTNKHIKEKENAQLNTISMFVLIYTHGHNGSATWFFYHSKFHLLGAGKMATQVIAQAAISKDSSSILRIHKVGHVANWNSNSMGSNVLFWSLWAPGMQVVHRYTCRWKPVHVIYVFSNLYLPSSRPKEEKRGL